MTFPVNDIAIHHSNYILLSLAFPHKYSSNLLEIEQKLN